MDFSRLPPAVVATARQAVLDVEQIAHGRLAGRVKKELVNKIVESIHILNDDLERLILNALIDFLVFVLFNFNRVGPDGQGKVP